MTWFISTTDVFWLAITLVAGWAWLSLASARWVIEKLGLKTDDVIAWLVVVVVAAGYGTPIVYIGLRVWG